MSKQLELFEKRGFMKQKKKDNKNMTVLHKAESIMEDVKDAIIQIDYQLNNLSIPKDWDNETFRFILSRLINESKELTESKKMLINRVFGFDKQETQERRRANA